MTTKNSSADTDRGARAHSQTTRQTAAQSDTAARDNHAIISAARAVQFQSHTPTLMTKCRSVLRRRRIRSIRDSGIISDELGEYQEHRHRTWKLRVSPASRIVARVQLSQHLVDRPRSVLRGTEALVWRQARYRDGKKRHAFWVTQAPNQCQK